MMKSVFESFQNRNFLRLWIAQIISQFGDRINQMALIGLIAARTPGSTVGLAKILSFTIIPVFLFGPIAGAYVDRWDRRRTLFVCDFLRALLVLTIPLFFIYWESMVPIYAVVFLVFSLSRFHVPAKMSIIPDLVSEKGLLMANSLVSTSGMIAFAAGCAFGGLLVERFGPRGGFFWNAATFLISGLIVFSMNQKIKIHVDRKQLVQESRKIISTLKRSLFDEIKEGLVYFFKHQEIRFVTVMMFVLFAAAGAVYIVVIVFIQESFQTMTRDLGFLAVILGAGLFFGAMVYGRFGQTISRFKTIFICLIFGGMTTAIFAQVIHRFAQLPVAGALTFLVGFVTGPIFIAANTIIHQVSRDEMRGRVFSSLEVVMHLGFLITMFLSAFLSDKLKVQNFLILTVVGIIFVAIGIIGFIQQMRGKDPLLGNGE